MDSMNKFAICLFADKESLLTPRKVYQILPDESADRSNYMRVIDDEGEDYLYPKKNFVILPVSKDVEARLLQVV
ncbi:hypothetical protein BH24ACI3_BH24ACI3_15910 [soil metagenome]